MFISSLRICIAEFTLDKKLFLYKKVLKEIKFKMDDLKGTEDKNTSDSFLFKSNNVIRIYIIQGFFPAMILTTFKIILKLSRRYSKALFKTLRACDIYV